MEKLIKNWSIIADWKNIDPRTIREFSGSEEEAINILNKYKLSYFLIEKVDYIILYSEEEIKNNEEGDGYSCTSFISFEDAEKNYIDNLEKEINLLTLKFLEKNENKLEIDNIKSFVEKIEDELVIKYTNVCNSKEKFEISSWTIEKIISEFEELIEILENKEDDYIEKLNRQVEYITNFCK